MKIIINRSDAIGDLLLTLPMAQAIKENFPKSHITFIVSPKCTDLLKKHDYVDNYWVFDSKYSFFKKFFLFWRYFKKEKADTYFHVGGSFIPTLIAWLLRVPFRGGLISKFFSLICLNKGVRQKRSIVEMHEAEYNLSLLSPLGINLLYHYREEIKPMLNLDEDEIAEARAEFINTYKLNKNSQLFFLHPGMTGHTLNWSSRNYARLILKLEQRFPDKYIFIISHTPSDEDYLKLMREHLSDEAPQSLKDKIIFFNGAIKGLRNYMGVLSTAKFFVGPSTGTTHIANVLKVPSLSLYSPIKVQSVLRWGPIIEYEKSKFLVPDVVCGERFQCAGNCCPYYECMGKIEVDDVVSEVSQLISE
jgi:heptosyltransferase-3